MRSTLRLLATVKPGRFLEPGTPTGLTGLYTHPSPRSTLLYIYSTTLDKLKLLPETSVYRQSAESLTHHRLKIVESIKPPGLAQWTAKANAKLNAHPEVFTTPPGAVDHDGGKHTKSTADGRVFVTTQAERDSDERIEEWDGEDVGPPELEGPRTSRELRGQRNIGMERPGSDEKTVEWEPEPLLEASQISEMEQRIGAGLIEEVIQVAEGELKLVDTMAESKVWEELSEKPPQGQWDYFARDQHTPGTQEPAQK